MKGVRVAMDGIFYSKSAPIAPPGITMLMYERLENTTMFSHNAKKTGYIVPCLNHYRTFNVFILSTGAVRISDTVEMKHHDIEFQPSHLQIDICKTIPDTPFLY